MAANEDLNAGGDFDIRSDVTINGAGSGTTIHPGQRGSEYGHGKSDPYHDRHATAVNINNVTIRNGNSTVNTLGGGVRIDNAANVVNFTNCIITANRVINSWQRFCGRIGYHGGHGDLDGMHRE